MEEPPTAGATMPESPSEENAPAAVDRIRARLVAVDHPAPPFDSGTIVDLPAPARRLLGAALPDWTPLHRSVALTMHGRIKLGPAWIRFTADQVLVAGVGFVWRPRVGGRLLGIRGADAFDADQALMDFRLHGRLTLVHEDGPDVARSAAGRLAAETVAWLPQALTPQAGARWTEVDDTAAAVALDTPEGVVDVEVGVHDDGRLRSIGLQRWNSDADPPEAEPFGGEVVQAHETDDGIRIAGKGTVGWGWGTPDEPDGAFFRYSVDEARWPAAPATA
ncbi:MAG: DUF6544 family protein [Actinomycetota bacterium]